MKLNSDLWRFFTRRNTCIADCNVCNSPVYFKASIANLKRHLERRHRTHFLKLVKESAENSADISVKTEYTPAIIIQEIDSEGNEVTYANERVEFNEMPAHTISKVNSQKLSGKISVKNTPNRILDDSSPDIENFSNRIRFHHESLSSSFENMNENDAFANYVAISLSKLSQTQAIHAQADIQSVLTKYRLQSYSNSSNNDSTNTSSDSHGEPVYVVSRNQPYGIEVTLQNSDSLSNNCNCEINENACPNSASEQS